MKFICLPKKTAWIWYLALSPLFSFPAFSQAQSTSPNSASSVGGSFLIRPWAVGQSITLQTKTYQNGHLNDTETDSYSIVGFEAVNGNNYFWVEIEKDRANGVTTVEKLQVRQPKDIDFENVLMGDGNIFNPRQRIRKITLPGRFHRSSTNEFEVPGDAVSQVENGPEPSEMKDLLKYFSVSPAESVQVQGGAYKASRFHLLPLTGGENNHFLPSIDGWGSLDVPILGLVKKAVSLKSQDGSELEQETELVSYSETDAAPSIKATPQFISLEDQKRMLEGYSKTHPALPQDQGAQ